MTDLNMIVKDFVAESVNGVLESHTFEHALQVAVDSAVRTALEECNIDKSVENAIEAAISDAAETAVEEAVSNYDFKEHIDTAEIVADVLDVVADVHDIEQITRAVCAAIDIDSKIGAKLADACEQVQTALNQKIVHISVSLEKLFDEALLAANEALEARINKMETKKSTSIFYWLFGR